MSVTFNEEQELARAQAKPSALGFQARIVRWGLAKDEKQAMLILLGVFGTCVIVAGFALLGADETTTISPKEYLEQTQNQQRFVR